MVGRVIFVLFLGAVAAGQGGRDPGKGAAPVIFLRWRGTVESDAIHRAAWRALEPHDVSRRRLAGFDRDEKKARAYLRANKDARIVVAYNPEIAALAREELPAAAVLEVHEHAGAHVLARADRKRFYAALRVMGFSIPDGAAARNQEFPGFGTLVWVKEGDAAPGKDVFVVSTTALLEDGRAVLAMRPDPRSLGLHLAAQILRRLRTGKPFARVTVQRMRLTVDLVAARRAGLTVPLRLLARADVVRRLP